SDGLHMELTGRGLMLGGQDAARFGLVDYYLGYLVDRNYSPRSIRSYGYALLAFCRWLAAEEIELSAVTTDVMLRFLAACRAVRVPGRASGSNVVRLDGRRLDGLSPATVNLRLAAVS